MSENSISRYPDFEKTIAKDIRGVALSAQEEVLLQKLFALASTIVSPSSVYKNSLSQQKLGKSATTEIQSSGLQWIKTSSIPPEQLFSVVRFYRLSKKTTPVNVEAQIFLKFNQEFWDSKLVSDVDDKQ